MIKANQQIIQWLKEDEYRYRALLITSTLDLPQWMIAAGFVRNMVWDKLHAIKPRRLNDIDVIYFDPQNLSSEQDRYYQNQLKTIAPQYPWSVKNQARMHLKNRDKPYLSCLDAMSYWPELETAVAASLSHYNKPELAIIAPFGCERLFQLTLSHNPVKPKRLFQQRIKTKRWLEHYSQLKLQ